MLVAPRHAGKKAGLEILQAWWRVTVISVQNGDRYACY